MSKKVRRNDPCPCGSGKKAKKCCLPQIRELQQRVSQGESPESLLVERIFGTKQGEVTSA